MYQIIAEPYIDDRAQTLGSAFRQPVFRSYTGALNYLGSIPEALAACF